jgi:ribosomal-protein-alanine N-acetyltransferase
LSANQIRNYLPQDFDALVALDHRCFPPLIAYPADELRYFVEQKDAIALVAEHAGTSVEKAIGGFLIAQIYRGRPTFQARIITIDVAPELRRARLGSLLMDACEAALRERLVSQVRLEVSVNNAAAIAFYHRYGYEIVGRLPAYYPAGEDAHSMQKRL